MELQIKYLWKIILPNLILEHEIPKGSRLYFGKTAKVKREIEQKITNELFNNDFEEIITPNFSFSGHQAIEDNTKLITIADETNNELALRADSTLDVVRIITKRLGRTTNHKKWFYCQPVFTYPANEYYQLGAEWIGHNNISDVINLNMKVLDVINIKPTLQLSNISLLQLAVKELNVDISLFKEGEVVQLFDMKIEWLTKLLYVKNVEDLELCISLVPNSMKEQIQSLINTAKDINYDKVIISPLYYSSMKYYDGIFFTVVEKNLTLAKGGAYSADDINSLGFALYTDNLLKVLGV
jgi:histidyl-tRNA synthetase